MPNTLSVRDGYPLSNRELSKIAGLSKGPLRDFIQFLASRDVVHFFDDFNGDAINLDNYAVANGGGAAVASFATNVQRSGVIRATTGTANDATASASLIMPLNWYGDANAGMEVRWKLETSVAAYKVEVGFIDAVPASNTGGVNDEDTPTFYAADSAIMSVDTAETFTTPGFYTNGSTSGQPDSRTSMAGIPGLTTGVTPIISTYITTRIQLLGNNAFCWMNGRLVASHNTDADGHVEGGVALAPWFYVAANSATSKSMDVDYLRVWADR